MVSCDVGYYDQPLNARRMKAPVQNVPQRLQFSKPVSIDRAVVEGKDFSWFPSCEVTKMTKIRVQIPDRVLLLILPILLGDLVDCCQRTGRHLLMPGAQERSAQEIITSFKNDFDLNVYFGLRKIGISRETGKLSDRTVQCT